ncbi:hypothetical protein I5M27_13825 [Adhaeribacter sp. BT258]|uniref:Uncharacterized protein n=1 Tax=Adhaeribacter terrigena TaxID=2793070 RepID=A0ABS1C3X5_9BACT|nr:hypothetical protein [Adhaeribacter terrigena]MBK0404069.1 hypothetical protein [Adhaeribacter terrigena]
MNRSVYYFKLVLPNFIFLGVYLLFLSNRELFSNATNNFTWAGYSFSVLVLVSISVYLNRAHRIRIRFEDKEACLDKLRRKFYQNGYELKGGRSNRLYFNKMLVQSSFFTPAVTVYIRKDQILVEGPKVKVDDVSDWFDEQDYSEAVPFEPEYELRLAS